MKICQILYSGLGGHGSVAFSIIGGDKEKSAKHSLVFVGIEPLLEEYAEFCERKKMSYRFLCAAKGKPWKHWRHLYAAVADQAPDALILHSVTSILPAAFYALRNKKPLIAVEHTPNHQKTRGERMTSWLASLLADRVVVLTDEYREELSGGFARGWLRKKVAVIPNGVDSDLFSRSEARKDQNIVRIGMAARLSATKRQDDLIRAMPHLFENRGSTKWLLSIAGDGDQVPRLSSLVKDLGLAEYVSFEGHLEGKDLVDWFSSLDIYVHSSDGEALSTSMLQAMSMELPVIGTDVPGISNLLHSDLGELGLLVMPGRPDLLAHAINDLANNVRRAAELACNARKAVEQRYNHVAMFNSYFKLIEEQCP